MSLATVIEVENASVRLRRDPARIRSLREYFVRCVEGRRPGVEWVEALVDVSFSLRRGEFFAVIGSNGAGKTTLLRLLAGIVPASAGAARVRGLVAPLIELGAGFDAELTGVENIYLYGTILGMKRAALRTALAEILDFAGLAAFADTPLKSYSTGMVARLGFAVATATRPDVLLVDEVLAVGDEAFRARCQKRIDDLIAQGASVVLVTHDLEMVSRHLSRALWLDHGRVRALGPAREIVAAYREAVAA
jgi:ABC-type polysaccharide/polyol phosphate transport system ATPase subunit